MREIRNTGTRRAPGSSNLHGRGSRLAVLPGPLTSLARASSVRLSFQGSPSVTTSSHQLMSRSPHTSRCRCARTAPRIVIHAIHMHARNASANSVLCKYKGGDVSCPSSRPFSKNREFGICRRVRVTRKSARRQEGRKWRPRRQSHRRATRGDGACGQA